MNHSTKAPTTVREAIDRAHELGMSLSEFLELMPPVPMPPTGYVLEKGPGTRWTGPEIINRGWIITPAWTWDGVAEHHTLELWTAKEPGYAGSHMAPAEALQLATDLIAAAQASVTPKSTDMPIAPEEGN